MKKLTFLFLRRISFNSFISAFISLTSSFNDFSFSPLFSDSFFLGGAAVILKAINGNQSVQSLIITNNQYSSGSWNNYTDTIVVDETDGYFVNVMDTYIDNLIIDSAYDRNKYLLKSTKIKKKLTRYNAKQWIFDLKNYLLFDKVGIEWIDYSFQLLDNRNVTVQHNVLEVTDKIVIIQTNVNCDGTVYLTVDQSAFS